MPTPRLSFLPLVALAAACSSPPGPAWPMGAGPNGNWTSSGSPPPVEFSVTRDHNVAWHSPLPETGQGGIAVAADKLFVATMAPWTGQQLSDEDRKKYSHAIEKRDVVGKHIDAHCLDAKTGDIVWTRRIDGEVPSIYSYPFSDATSASPVANGTHAWFTNAGGQVVCYTHAGDIVWTRKFTPTFDGPFNKQFEPFLVDDPARGENAQTFVHMEPFETGSDNMGVPGPKYNFLVGLDSMTGERLWTSRDALTHYNAPVLVQTKDGPCVLHGRGGPHAVPERPVGMSLTRVTGAKAGERVWRYEDKRGNHEAALQTMAADDDYAYWLLKEPRNACVVVDIHTGEEVREISLVENVIVNGEKQAKLDKGVFPARYSMHAANGRLFFQCYATAWGKPTLAPPYSFGCVDPNAEHEPAVRYVEVPSSFEHDDEGNRTLLWRTRRTAKALNSKQAEATGDKRSHWDGWDWVFNGSPTRVDNHAFWTLASGIVYVFDVDVVPFSKASFRAINDLGANGCTWTANSVSYANGRLYHRTAAYLYCFANGN